MLLYRSNHFGRPWNLDEQIGTLRASMQLRHRADGPRGIVCQQGRDFQRNPAVYAAGAVVDLTEQVGGLDQILERQFKEQRFARFALCCLLADRGVVMASVLDGFIEDRWVGGEPRHRKIADVAPQCAVRQQAARDVIEPKALAEIMQLLGRLHDASCYAPAAASLPSSMAESALTRSPIRSIVMSAGG